MNHKEARLIGRGLIVIGILLIIFAKLWLGLAFVAAGMGFSLIFARCPNCGRTLAGVSITAKKCPRCGKRLK